MPNVIILACQLDGTASLALVDGIFLVQPEAKVLILSKNPRDEESFSVISRLVSVLPRNVQADVLTQTVEAASVGKVPRDNTTDVDTQAVCNGAKTVLSGREYEILALIAKGNTNKDIARLLDIGNETVKFHVSNTLRKLSARSRAHAVAIVCQKP